MRQHKPYKQHIHKHTVTCVHSTHCYCLWINDTSDLPVVRVISCKCLYCVLLEIKLSCWMFLTPEVMTSVCVHNLFWWWCVCVCVAPHSLEWVIVPLRKREQLDVFGSSLSSLTLTLAKFNILYLFLDYKKMCWVLVLSQHDSMLTAHTHWKESNVFFNRISQYLSILCWTQAEWICSIWISVFLWSE